MLATAGHVAHPAAQQLVRSGATSGATSRDQRGRDARPSRISCATSGATSRNDLRRAASMPGSDQFREETGTSRVSMTFRVMRTNQYNQDLGLIHSTNGNHLESLNEGSSIDPQVTIYLHAQNITMFPTNETWYFASQILVSSSGGLILILTAQSTRT
ncbi:hypothetical protein F511_19740 [Dorcoceras hygrometricum]|uniref:Uncharacterized protein n=1 Tax=Dorcoceras hygrometricum TaxID=472368 RepID=A0A2Z7A5X5_9LAMI|nr:hypothetical protein F511_19740 [Dorcoceras hygrometricum]